MHAYFRYAAFGSYGLSRILPPPKSYCAGHCQNISQTSHLTKDRRRAIALRRSSPADAGLHKREYDGKPSITAHRRNGRNYGSQMQTRSHSQFWSSYSRLLSYRTPPKRT